MCGSGRCEDYFLTIGGGYAPEGNQASLENNVLFFQRTLQDTGLAHKRSDVFFSDGNGAQLDLQVIDPGSIPKANRLMAEFFGSRSDLGLSYRNHRVPDVQGSTRPENIRKWFNSVGGRLKSQDRLMIYVTAHGNGSSDRQNPHNTTIATWNNSAIRMTEFVALLDTLPPDVDVVTIMVQCHAGGFARFIFNDGDPEHGISPQNRCGFFATVHDRQAAGCTSEVDELSYVEYSTYFWAALSGRTRTGEKIVPPDYNGDGIVSFAEAHGYTVVSADTIDLPVTASEEFLTEYSRFRDDDSRQLLDNDESYSLVLSLATPTQRAVLEGLSTQLDLAGDNRIVDAWRATSRDSERRDFRRRREPTVSDTLRRQIANDTRRKWPELSNVLNPLSVDLITSRSEEFVRTIEGHAHYGQYLQAVEAEVPNAEKRKVKYERFVRFADNVVLAENLKRIGNEKRIAQYERIVAAESGSLRN